MLPLSEGLERADHHYERCNLLTAQLPENKRYTVNSKLVLLDFFTKGTVIDAIVPAFERNMVRHQINLK